MRRETRSESRACRTSEMLKLRACSQRTHAHARTRTPRTRLHSIGLGSGGVRGAGRRGESATCEREPSVPHLLATIAARMQPAHARTRTPGTRLHSSTLSCIISRARLHSIASQLHHVRSARGSLTGHTVIERTKHGLMPECLERSARAPTAAMEGAVGWSPRRDRMHRTPSGCDATAHETRSESRA
jgi:hypothetical protein